MLVSMKELNSKKADLESKTCKVYYLDDLVLKRFLHLDNSMKRLLEKKYECSKNIYINRVSMPIDKLETENGFCGYVEKILPGYMNKELKLYTDYYNENRENILIEDITSYILSCHKIVDDCHKFNIINPDLTSAGNTFFNPKTRDVYFTDYQGMQVDELKTRNISDFIAFDPILSEEKYIKDDLYNKNIDLYSLAIRYFYYISKINIPRVMSFYNLKIDELINMAGIENTSFAECLKILYDKEKDNEDIKEAITSLSKEYKMSKFVQGEVRRLTKK